jgi:glycogen debranching enzyme
VVTPRSGKAVEINSLWYNAFAINARLLETVGRKDKAKKYLMLAEKIMTRFSQVF